MADSHAIVAAAARPHLIECLQHKLTLDGPRATTAPGSIMPHIVLSSMSEQVPCPHCQHAIQWDVPRGAAKSEVPCPRCGEQVVVFTGKTPAEAVAADHAHNALYSTLPTPYAVVLRDYELTLAFIDKMDGQLAAFRNLAVLSTSAVIAFSVSESNATVLLANAVLVPCFVFADFVQKQFHEDGISRSFKLESALHVMARDGQWPTDYVFGIGHAIRAPTFRRVWDALVHPARWHIRFVYLLMLLLSVVAYAFI